MDGAADGTAKVSVYDQMPEEIKELTEKREKQMATGQRKVNTRMRIMMVLLSLCLALSGILYSPSDETGVVHAASGNEINSMEDYYTKLADQIYRREVGQYYTVRNQSLGKQILHADLSGFQAHVNPEDPLRSGCYLCYYLETVYYTYSGTQLQVMITYPYVREEMDRHFQKMDSLALELKGKDDYETVKNVHDYLVKNFEYDYSTSMVNHTDIDGFRDGKMVCSGYGLATYYLLNKVGIKTEIITGSAGETLNDEATHMWNMVRVEGKWYNLDVTWDDPGGSGVTYTYFLKSDVDFPRHRRLGAYNNDYYNSLVSEESYPMPKQASYTWLILVFSILLFLVVLFTAWGRNTDPEDYHGYVVGEDSLSGDGRYDGEQLTWNAEDRWERHAAGQGSPWDTMDDSGFRNMNTQPERSMHAGTQPRGSMYEGTQPRGSMYEDVQSGRSSEGTYGTDGIYYGQLRGSGREGRGMDAAHRTGQRQD